MGRHGMRRRGGMWGLFLPNRLGDLRKRRKSPQRGLERSRSPSRQRF